MNKVEQVLICPACGHKNPASARFCQNDGYPLRDGSPDDPLVGRLVGNYRLLQRKGEGGFGVVYLAEHNNLKTRYAVKILHPQFSANRHIAERFRREALAAGRMRHENVVSIADFDQAPGVGYYYVMEYLEGKTLKLALDEGEEFSPARILHVARQVTSAMERVHSLNIVHRDLKPENIFLLEEGDVTDYVKLVDFGIAKIMNEEGSSLTRTGLSVGTPLYMSPEQARGQIKALNHRTDIYSWGIILFEMLTYRPPFFSENPHEVVMMQIREMPPRLAEVCPDRQYSPDLEAFVRRVLAKDPAERPASMIAMYEELEDILSAPDVIVDTGMTQVMEQREHLSAGGSASLTTPTATQTTREVLEEESLHDALESTGEQIQPDLSKLESSPTSQNEALQDADQDDDNSANNDTPDWRQVFSSEKLDDADLPETFSGQESKAELAASSLSDVSTTAETEVPENVVEELRRASHDDLPLPPLVDDDEDTGLSESLLPAPEQTAEAEPTEAEPTEAEPTAELDEPAVAPSTPLPGDIVEAEVTSKNKAIETASADEREAQATDEEDEYAPRLTSFSTDPNALRSPLQRYGMWIGGAVVAFLVLVLGVIAWMRSSEPEPPIDYQSLMNKVNSRKNLAPRVVAPRSRRPLPRRAVVRPTPSRVAVAPGVRVRPRPGVLRVFLSVKTSPSGARCLWRVEVGSWEKMPACSLWHKVGERVDVRVQHPGFLSRTRTWLPKQNDSWYIRLRRRGGRRSRRAVRRRAAPARRRTPARRRSVFDQAGNIFEKSDNPFRDGKKK